MSFLLGSNIIVWGGGKKKKKYLSQNPQIRAVQNTYKLVLHGLLWNLSLPNI